jgi:hypothetical protein
MYLELGLNIRAKDRGVSGLWFLVSGSLGVRVLSLAVPPRFEPESHLAGRLKKGMAAPKEPETKNHKPETREFGLGELTKFPRPNSRPIPYFCAQIGSLGYKIYQRDLFVLVRTDAAHTPV